jgi:hypothetical protein
MCCPLFLCACCCPFGRCLFFGIFKQQQRPYTLTPEQQQQQLIAEKVIDFEFEKYKCGVLLRLVGTVEIFHWFRFTEFIG